MPSQRSLVWCLLAATLHWMDVVGQVENSTITPVGRRVIGGRVITNEQLGGYLVVLRYRGTFVCGATLIEDLIVLSAAHCFENRDVVEDWEAHGGVSRLSETGTRRRVKQIIRAAAFKMSTMDMDVAVLLLDSPMVGKGIHKISLCDTDLPVGKNLIVAGFGMIQSSGRGPDQFLRSASVPVISKSSCRRTYSLSAAITDSMLCASVLGKRDACTFDSGGPLVVNKQICGIVSFGVGCASDTYPGVYTDVNYVKPFILKSIKSLMSHS